MTDETGAQDMDALFAALQSAAEDIAVPSVDVVEAQAEWVAPHVVAVDLPMDVSIALDELSASLQQFVDTAMGFLDSDHLDVAGIAQQLEPVGSPGDYPATEEQLAQWQATVDGRTRGFTELAALVDDDRRLVRQYSERVAEIFAGAPPPPEPPPPPPPPDEEEPGADEPPMTPV